MNVLMTLLGMVWDMLTARKGVSAMVNGVVDAVAGGDKAGAKGGPKGSVSATLDKVKTAVSGYVGADERAAEQGYAAVADARAHDRVLMEKSQPMIVDALRGVVRPLITLAAFGWYVYARVNGIELNVEDYSIIGGIVAFWFGFRVFDRRR